MPVAVRTARTPIQIQPYTPEWTPAVRSFNERLAAGGVADEFRFPEDSVPAWLPRVEGRPIYQEYYLATEGGAVRGACILKHQPFWVGGVPQPVVYYHLPISEGLVDRAYATVGVQMLRSALRSAPLLFCLGMGGFDKPLPQMLKAMRWHMSAVPFFFHLHRPAACLRQLRPLRSTWLRRLGADAAALTGLGWMGITAVQRARMAPADRSLRADAVETFGTWADEVWIRCRATYRLVGCRDRTTLNALYPGAAGVHRLRVSRAGGTLGWAVVRDTQMRGNKYFGGLRVGSIVDCLAAPDHADAVVRVAASFLQDRGVDLVVSNQAHAHWGRALARSGFLGGPSNFVFAASQGLGQLIVPFEQACGELHLNRGDGDGPVHL